MESNFNNFNDQNSSKPKKPRTAAWIAGGIVVIGILFALGLGPKLSSESSLSKDAKEAADALPEVDVISPRLAPPDPILLPASIQAISTTPVQARTSGYVQKLFVDIGTKVKAGQVLAVIESPDADQQVLQANADTAKSRATVGESIAAIARSQAGVSQSRADLARQRANIKQAEAALASAKSKLAQTVALRSQAEAHLAQSKQGVSLQNANLQQARAQNDLAITTVKRYENLLKEGYVSQQDYDQAVATFKTAAAAVNAAKANVSAAQADVQSSQQALNAMDSSVEAAKSDTDAARENVNAAHSVYDSLKASVTAAKAGVNASKADADASRAAVNSSEANARRYEVIRGFEQVVAPFDGVITSRNVDIGSLVSPGAIATANTANSSTPTLGLFGIARTDTLRIFINVPQTNIQTVKPGGKAKIMVQELPNQVFEGTIMEASGALDSTNRTLLTEIRLANPTGKLLPGMYANVLLTEEHPTPVLRIPANTLQIDAQGTRVFVVVGDTVHIKTVKIGRDFGTEVEILDGVQPGDKLVSNPNDALKDGGKVTIAPPPPVDPNAPAPAGAGPTPPPAVPPMNAPVTTVPGQAKEGSKP